MPWLIIKVTYVSLARSELLGLLNIHSEDTIHRDIMSKHGRRACNHVVKSLDVTGKLNLPSIIECNAIPSLREAIHTLEVAWQQVYIQNIEDCIPPMDDDRNALLLLGRNLTQPHHVRDQLVGTDTSPEQ